MTETWSPQTTYEPLKESIRGAECMSLSLHTKVRFKVLIPKLLKVFNDLTDFSALTRSVLIPTKLNRKENILINMIYFWVVCTWYKYNVFQPFKAIWIHQWNNGIQHALLYSFIYLLYTLSKVNQFSSYISHMNVRLLKSGKKIIPNQYSVRCSRNVA